MRVQPMTAAQAQPETVALFVSDLHLSPARPKTTQAFFDFLRLRAPRARKLYLLGDVFEAWIGDDDLSDPWNRSIADAIRAVSDAGCEVFWIGGNRDLLVGKRFAQVAGCTLLAEPHLFELAGQRIALVHGDAQCTHDLAYMRFRAKTHHPFVQKVFLALPLAWRRSMIAGMRSKSTIIKQIKSEMMMDVSQAAIDALFDATGASILIHGHTHHVARYDSADGSRRRYVLTDWECETKPERGGWISLYADGSLRHFDIQGRMITRYPGT